MLLDEFVLTPNFLKWYNRFDNLPQLPVDRRENPNDYGIEEVFRMMVDYIMDTDYLVFNRHHKRRFMNTPYTKDGEAIGMYLWRVYNDKYENINPDVESLTRDMGKELLLSTTVIPPKSYRT